MINLLPRDKDNIRVKSVVISQKKKGEIDEQTFFFLPGYHNKCFFSPLGFVEKEDGTCGSHEL